MADESTQSPRSSAGPGGKAISGPAAEEAARREANALVAHELRAPLTVIKGYLDILQRPLDDTARLAALASMDRAVKRLDTVLDDLLAVSTDHRVFVPHTITSVSFSELASEIVDELEPLHGRSVEVSGSAGMAECDARLMRQVLVNLIGNALKHTSPPETVSVSVMENPASVVVRVEDDGPGVAPADRDRVFLLFERLESSGGMPPGLGVGLPVARTIAQHHGGSLRLVDCARGGACFELTVPRTCETSGEGVLDKS